MSKKGFSIIVLGGAGDVGSRTVEDLVIRPNVAKVTIADRNEAGAKAIKEKLDQKARSRLDLQMAEVAVAAVDAFNHTGLVEVIKGHDVCASALGPFHLFEVRCARASIEAGVDYCSVCDDWNAAADVIDQLHSEAQRRKVTCVTGFGATPGVSNMVIAWFASKMDYATEAHISCFQPLNAGGGEAVLRHMLFVMSGSIPVVRDGIRKDIKSCSESSRIEFAKFGTKTVWSMGHAEPATLHRYIPSLRTVEFKMGFGFGSRFLVIPAWLGLFRFAFFIWLTVKIFTFLEMLMKMFPKGMGALRIDVNGIRDGRPCHEEVHGTGEMREVTGLSLSVGAVLMAEKKTKVSQVGGVYAPEGAMTFEFLHHMIDKGILGCRDVAMRHPYTHDDI